MIENYTVNLDGNMAANAKTDQTAVRGLAEQLGALQHSTTSLEGSINALGEKLESLVPHADHAKESSESMFMALGEFELAKRGLELVGEGIVEAGRFAIEASEHVDEMTRSFAALLGTSDAGGGAALAQIRAIADTLPQASNQVEKWAQGLMAVGQTDMGKLNDSLHAIAGAEAMIAGGGERVNALLQKLNSTAEKGTKLKFNVTALEGTGVTEAELLERLGMSPRQLEVAKKTATLTGGQIADALTGALNAKSKDALASQMNTLGAVFTKGRDMVQRLFEGVDFGPIAEQLRSLFSVFDQAFPSGDAMKKGIGGALQSVVNAIASAIPTIRHLFLEFVLDALLAYNAIRPLAATVASFFSALDPDMMIAGLKVLGLGIAVIVGGFIALGVAAVAAVALVIQGLGVIAKGAEAAGNWLGDAVFAIVQFVSKAAGFAGDFIAGFVKGITDGIGNVTKAVENMGASAVSGIKGILGIHSPSTVTRALGDDGIGGGLALGMAAANDNVHAAGSTLGARAATGTRDGIASAGPPPPSFAGAAPGATRETTPAAAPAGGDIHVNARFVVEISGAVTKGQAEEATEIFEEQWASLQERIALARGVAA